MSTESPVPPPPPPPHPHQVNVIIAPLIEQTDDNYLQFSTGTAGIPPPPPRKLIIKKQYSLNIKCCTLAPGSTGIPAPPPPPPRK